MKHELLLGFTNDREVVFAEIDNSRGYFAVCFNTSYPMAIGEDEVEERIESYIESMDDSTILDMLKRFDCSPSDLPKNLHQESYDVIGDFFDNSLYTESFRIEGINDDIYFLASSCGQHDTRGQMTWCKNTELYNYIHELWDEYHLKEIPKDKYDKLIDAVEHQNATIDNYRVVEQYLKVNFDER